MGAYLSEPVTEKISSDEADGRVEFGASSMQGWRVNQEDAHNTILDFDENTSLFAVYDGHGGAEVATYCSQKLPNFIKDTDAYKSGEMVQALENAFLWFDATITTPEVMTILKELAGEVNPPPSASDNEESDEGENVNNLCQEATLPLQDVLAKYEKNGALPRARLLETTPLSPCLRAKRNSEPGCSGALLSSADASTSGAGTSGAGSSKQMDIASSSNSEDAAVNNGDGDAGVSSTNSTDYDKELNGEVSTSDVADGSSKVEKSSTATPDSSEDNCLKPEQSEEAIAPGTSSQCNGDVNDGEENNITSSNGAVPANKDSVSSTEAQDSPKKIKKALRLSAAAVYKTLMQAAEDDEDSDSNDETFEGGEVNSSDEENVNGISDSDCEGEEEDEEEEGESSDEDYEEDISLAEEPGNDSGCTAVVAILRGNELYVANAGDSRCIICREGKAIDMSIDHKPEDAPELERITKAGGKVSNDGRINGGLNLSRAIGDHSYKQNKDLGPKEQMITALPDVKTLTIDPKKDEFMVLACDGIWNFMSSQDVCDFILPKLVEGRERLSQICEEMFDHCLAPSTIGDGTGCDNMTAILIRFKDGLVAEVAQHTASTETKKRAADDEDIEEKQESKRQKVDDSLSSSIVTSSV